MKTLISVVAAGVTGSLFALAAPPVGPAHAAAAVVVQEESRSYTYADLVRRMIDVEHVATLPQPGEATAQFSSYDRRSAYNRENGQYEHWQVNGDGSGIVREEDGQLVLAEIDGPGVIWRIWSALPQEGRVKFYFDGSDEPAVDLPFIQYFDHSQAPFNHPALAYVTDARGHNLYLPISFAKSCKIVAEPGWGRYFQFTYSTFPDGTKVPTFKRELNSDEQVALREVGDFLGQRLGQQPGGQREGQETTSRQTTVQPAETTEVAQIEGERAIVGLRVKPGPFDNAAEAEKALREVLLKITWDGQDNAAVLAPLGDFFGSPMGLNEYKSLTSGIVDGEMYSYWFMPFAESAKIELVNDGNYARQVAFEIDHAPLQRSANEYGHFHAKYHRGERSDRADRWPDWQFLDTEGRGRFAGMLLHVWNGTGKGHNRKYGLDGGHWWGEGDEKFFVDGEEFPSTYGTGTEDYFGYAWCDPSYFQQAFHGQPLTQNNHGHQAVYRWQVADAIPFQSRFDGNMEKYFNEEWPTRYSTVAYWYLSADGKDSYTQKPSLHDRLGYFVLSPAYEGENLKVKNITGGDVSKQTLMQSRGTGASIWSGGTQLWWRNGEIGDTLTLAVPVTEPGRYKVYVGSTQAKDYGIGKLTFAGQSPLQPYDFFNGELWPAELYLGEYDLTRGEHDLTLEIVGKNERAEEGNFLGVDYVKLEPVKAAQAQQARAER